MNLLQIPKHAVECFEKWSNTKVAVYSWDNFLSSALPRRFLHEAKGCVCVKAEYETECIRFDHLASRHDMWLYPDGCLKICHAGYLEWGAAVWHRKKLCGILFAGIRQAPEKISLPIPLYSSDYCIQKTKAPEAPATDEKEILLIHEGLQQLSARLEKWLDQISDMEQIKSELTREELVHFLIRRDCAKGMTLDQLGKHLHLSSSRTAHLVKELTGQRFKELVNRNRLELAAKRLKYGNKTVREIADECGFENVSHFHRLFRQYFHKTPLDYRKENNTA